MADLLRPDQIEGNLPNLNNLLTNPDLEIWQRGDGPFTTMADFTADEWWLSRNSVTETASVSKVASPKTGLSAIQVVAAMNGGIAVHLIQGLENYKSLEGLWLTFSAWVRADLPDAVRITIEDYDGATFASGTHGIHSGSGNWERLTSVKKIRSGLASAVGRPHNFGINLFVSSTADATYQMDGASLVIGNFPQGIPPIPLHTADDASRCSRYYLGAPKVIRGHVNADGTIALGTGFSVLHIGPGIYQVIFTTPFATPPTVVAMTADLSGTGVESNGFPTVNTVQLQVRNYSTHGVQDAPFAFLAAGE